MEGSSEDDVHQDVADAEVLADNENRVRWNW
jgi:hypothetical protein